MGWRWRVFAIALFIFSECAWAQTFRTLHRFTGGSDGQFPNAAVVIGRGGVLYGTTFYGGANVCNPILTTCGTVFSVTPPASPGSGWTETVVYNFAGGTSDGENPLPPWRSAGAECFTARRRLAGQRMRARCFG